MRYSRFVREPQDVDIAVSVSLRAFRRLSFVVYSAQQRVVGPDTKPHARIKIKPARGVVSLSDLTLQRLLFDFEL